MLTKKKNYKHTMLEGRWCRRDIVSALLNSELTEKWLPPVIVILLYHILLSSFQYCLLILQIMDTFLIYM